MNKIIRSNVVHISLRFGGEIYFVRPRGRSTKGNRGNYHQKIFSDLYSRNTRNFKPPSNLDAPVPTREILFLIYIEKSFLSIRVYNFSFRTSFACFIPFFPPNPFPRPTLSVSPWKSTLLRPYFPPVFTQASLLAKLKILMRSWKSEIWYSSPFTLPLFAAAMLREKGTSQTNRKIRMKLIETKGWFCFRYDLIDIIKRIEWRIIFSFFFFSDSFVQ